MKCKENRKEKPVVPVADGKQKKDNEEV
jgi:hypothetical protein